MKREKKKQKAPGPAVPESPVTGSVAGEPAPAPSPAPSPAPAEKKQKQDRERSGEGSGVYSIQPDMIGAEKSGIDGVRILQAIAVLIAIAAVGFMVLRFLA